MKVPWGSDLTTCPAVPVAPAESQGRSTWAQAPTDGAQQAGTTGALFCNLATSCPAWHTGIFSTCQTAAQERDLTYPWQPDAHPRWQPCPLTWECKFQQGALCLFSVLELRRGAWLDGYLAVLIGMPWWFWPKGSKSPFTELCCFYCHHFSHLEWHYFNFQSHSKEPESNPIQPRQSL